MNSGEGVPGHNSVLFSGKPMGSEEFLIRMIKALGITIDRYPKGRHNNN